MNQENMHWFVAFIDLSKRQSWERGREKKEGVFTNIGMHSSLKVICCYFDHDHTFDVGGRGGKENVEDEEKKKEEWCWFL